MSGRAKEETRRIWALVTLVIGERGEASRGGEAHSGREGASIGVGWGLGAAVWLPGGEGTNKSPVAA
jgi:hypothetical protein